MSRRAASAYLLVLSLLLAGCGDRLLERSYSSLVPHSAAYRETESANTLRAENYQDLVNALLILLGDHSEAGAVRIYGDAPDKAQLAENACVEVQKETALGAYLLDYITYEGKAESGYYELTVRFGYRRTAEEQAAIVNATSTEALPDLLRAAIDEGREAVAVRVGYFGTSRDGVLALLADVHEEFYPTEPEEAVAPEGEAPEAAEVFEAGELPEDEPEEPTYDLSPWQVLFYPNSAQPGIIEVVLGGE